MADDDFFLHTLDDSPKTNPWTEDDLGYAPFAQRLAEALVKIKVPKGYVVGLHGRWGSGKSTALNFVNAFINKWSEEDRIETKDILRVDFRPWMIGEHESLVSAFFKVLREAMSDPDDRCRRFRRIVARVLGSVVIRP